MNSPEDIPEEQVFDIVARFLYNKPLQEARKEFYLYLFAEWSRANLDVILKALTTVESTSNNKFH
ncbi:MAG: hypothetical protein ACFE8U_16450 [Candidatus Hermodarchaeota archaeon]